MNAPLNLTPIAAAIGGAASAESKARDKWLTASKAASKAGVTVAMITKGTTKEPNAAFDAVVYETLRQFIITGISAGKTAEKYDAARPDASGEEAVKGASTWTMAQIVNLTKEQLRDIDSDKLKMMRRSYMQLVDGTMMGRLRSYMDRIENPEPKEKGTKAKPAAKASSSDQVSLLSSQTIAVLLPRRRALASRAQMKLGCMAMMGVLEYWSNGVM